MHLIHSMTNAYELLEKLKHECRSGKLTWMYTARIIGEESIEGRESWVPELK